MEQKRFLTESVHSLPRDHAFNGIDLVKFICAILICVGHIPLFSTPLWGRDVEFYLQNWSCRVTVCFYFMASGFFLFRKTDLYDLQTDRIRTYVFRIVRLMGVWTILLFQGSHMHLWYLGSLAVAVILLSFLLKKKVRLGVIAALALAAYFIGLFGDSYYGMLTPLRGYHIPNLLIDIFEKVIPSTRNGFSFGFLFVLMGALFAQKRIVVNKIAAVFGFAVSFAAMFFEAHWLRHSFPPKAISYNMFVFSIPAAFFLFYLASHLQLKNRPIYRRLRVIGLLVFFMHLFVDYFVQLVLGFAEAKLGTVADPLRFVCTVSLTIVLAVMIERLSETKRFSFLKKWLF